jgi:hypothetical protein
LEVCEAYLVKRTEAAALAGEMRALARLAESACVDESAKRAKRARWGGRVRMTTFLTILREIVI